MSDVSLFILSIVDRRLRKDGREIDPFLRGTSVGPAQLHRVRPGRCTWDEFASVLEALADDLGGLDALALWSGSLVSDSPSLLTMLSKRYVKPHSIYHVGSSWYGPSLIRVSHGHTARTDDGIVQTIDLPPEYRPSSAVGHFMAGILASTPTLVGWPPGRVRFVEEPHRYVYYVALTPPGTETLDPREVDRERKAVDQDLAELIALQPDAGEASAEDEVGANHADPLVKRVQRLLAHAEDGVRLTPANAARRLGLSERSLSRGLSREGTTFRRLRDERREDLAVRWLGVGHTIEDVARALDFSDARAFHRAFRRWTGRSPGSFRPGT